MRHYLASKQYFIILCHHLFIVIYYLKYNDTIVLIVQKDNKKVDIVNCFQKRIPIYNQTAIMNVEETSRFGSKKGRKLTSLTNIQKKELCKYKRNNPTKSYEEIGRKFALANQL